MLCAAGWRRGNPRRQHLRSDRQDIESEQRPIIGAGEGGVEPGAKLSLWNLSLRDTRQHDGTGENLASGVVLARAARGEGLLARFEPGLTGLELLEFGFERGDSIVDFRHGRGSLMGVPSFSVQ